MISNWWGRFRLDVHLTTIDILEDHLATDHEIDNWTWVNIFAEIFFMPSYTNSMGIFRNLWKYFKYVSSPLMCLWCTFTQGWAVVPGHCRDPGPKQKRGTVPPCPLPIPAFTNRIYGKKYYAIGKLLYEYHFSHQTSLIWNTWSWDTFSEGILPAAFEFTTASGLLDYLSRQSHTIALHWSSMRARIFLNPKFNMLRKCGTKDYVQLRIILRFITNFKRTVIFRRNEC